jgi:GntR family transcriptional regulator, phosphonate transport system regulatory protein
MTVARGSGVALWKQIAEALAGEIASNVLRPSERLPTEIDLATRFGVNRHTVRRAVQTLEDRGLVRVQQGRGTFVTADTLYDYRLGDRVRFTDLVARQARRGQGELLAATVEPAGAAEAAALELREGAPLVVLEILSRVDGLPVTLGRHSFSGVRFPTLADVYVEEGSITRALRRLGVPDYTRRRTTVTARAATPEERERLEMPRTVPLIVAESLNVDPDGRPLEHGVARFAANRVQIVFEPGG